MTAWTTYERRAIATTLNDRIDADYETKYGRSP